jgi:hypothetical protein
MKQLLLAEEAYNYFNCTIDDVSSNNLLFRKHLLQLGPKILHLHKHSQHHVQSTCKFQKGKIYSDQSYLTRSEAFCICSHLTPPSVVVSSV